MGLCFHCQGSPVSKRSTPFWTKYNLAPEQSLNPKVLCKIWVMYLLLVYIVLWGGTYPFLLLLELRSAFWFKAYCLSKFGITAPFTPCVYIRLYYRSNVLMLPILAEMLVTYNFKMGCNDTNCNSFAFLHRNYVVHSKNNKHPAFFIANMSTLDSWA